MEELNNNTEATTCCCTQEPSKSKCAHTWTIVGMVIMFIGLVVLYILHFTSQPKSLANPEATPVVSGEGLKVAYINTDTLMSKYQYAIDLQEDLAKYQTSKESSYTQQMQQFQTDYDNYLKTGADMTLTQQKAKEQELQNRMTKLQSLEGEYAMQIQQKALKENEKMIKAVYAYIREYNKANQNFDLILSISFLNSPLLYGNPGMDITDEIVKGLNEEYKNVKEDDTKKK